MRAKKYILSMAMVYMAYFTHGIQAIILSQNKVTSSPNGDIQTKWQEQQQYLWPSQRQVLENS